jgi:tRNA(adenine34) deaminase
MAEIHSSTLMEMILKDDIYWMREALEQARCAESANEVPVGAVLVDANNEWLASGHNQPISSHDPTAHAEIVVLREGARKLQNYRLVGTTLYVTLEPCAMCIGAMVHARVGRLVYAATEPRAGAVESSTQLLETIPFNHRIEITSGILGDESASLLSQFFARRRQKNSK